MTTDEASRAREDHFLEHATLRVEAAQPGLLFQPGETAQVRLFVGDVPPGIDEVVASLRCQDAYGGPREVLPSEVRLRRPEGFGAELSVAAEPGYYEASYELALAGTTREGEERGERFSFGVVPAAPAEREPDSPFGVNTHFNQGWDPALGQIVKRAG